MAIWIVLRAIGFGERARHCYSRIKEFTERHSGLDDRTQIESFPSHLGLVRNFQPFN